MKIIKDSLEKLFFSLEKLMVLHRDLIELLSAEYRQMGILDMPALTESAHSKEIFLESIWKYEQLRLGETKTLSKLLNIDYDSKSAPSLLEIAEAIDKQSFSIEKEKLLKLRTVLQMLMNQAKESNSRNRVFAESSLIRIEEMKKNVLGLSNNNSENYANNGARKPISEQGGKLLSTEA